MKRKVFQGTTLKEVGEGGTGLAVFATMNVVDKDGDVTLPGAFGEQLAKVVPAHDWGHVPLGKTRIYEQGADALAEFKLNLDIEAARDWHSALKFDLAEGAPLQEWSYGYDPVEFSFGDFNGQRVRFLKKIKVHEVSPVLLGAGEGTRTLMMKAAHGLPPVEQAAAIKEQLADLLDRLKEIKARRNANGQGDLAQKNREELALIKSGVDALAALGLEIDVLLKGDAEPDEGRKLLSQYLAIVSGVKAR